MTMTYAEIKEGVRGLRRAEQYDLLQNLKQELEPPSEEEAVEAAWDAEIDARMKEVEEGKVVLLTRDEARIRRDAAFAKMGFNRNVVTA